MIFEYISLMLGILKVLSYKLLQSRRIKFQSIPKMNHSFKIAIKKTSKLKLGKSFRTRNNVSFRIYDGGVVNIGDRCFFNDGCSINAQQNITIGDDVIFGQNVMLFDHDHDYKNNINNFIKEDIKIGNNVWVGANCIILRGVTIGNNVVIAAGTTIRNDIKSNTIVYQKRNTIVREKR